MTREEAKEKVKQMFDAVDALRTEQVASDEEYRQRVEAAELDAVQCQAEVERELGEKLPTKLARRRVRVLELLQRGTSVGRTAQLVGVSRSLVENDVYQLTRRGLYPVPLRAADDEESRRRNHVLRFWSYASVRAPADVAKYTDVPESTVLSDLRWLASHGYTSKDTPTPAMNETPPDEETPRDPPRDAPPAQTAVPPPPAAVTHTATGAELARELGARSPSPEGTYDLVTSKCCEHRHVARVNSEGNGCTVPDEETGHSHRVSRFCIMSSSKHCHDFQLPQP